ncbi:MAG TPA: FGGY family carbohydrate kinase [Solirubrobacteraceae bacterium]|nr:FGGY family carbohydrate kinase [Solirubrobacteraceae bacterium]
MKTLVGIDEGTSAVKAAMFDLELRPIASVRRDKHTRYPGDGLVEQDPAEILEAVIDAVAALLDEVPDAEVVACGLDHQGESVLAWDRMSGEPLSPVVTWQDKRSQLQLAAFDEATLATIVERSGLPVDPYFSAGKVAWLLEQGLPDDVCIGTVDSYLCAELGAGFATDRSTASRTQLARLGEGMWDDELCAIFGVRGSCLPRLRDSVGELGTLRHGRWRTELPLRAQIVDQQAALAGTGCVLPGRAKATFGTGVFVLAFTGAVAPAGATAVGVVPTIAWAVDGLPRYALDGGVFSAGSLLEWLAGGLGLYESPQQLAELAASVETAHGVKLLPALSGLGAPWWNPNARGVVSGLSAGTEPAHLARAAIEAICHRVCDVLDAMRGFVRIEELRIDGGLTQSELLPQLLADLVQVPVVLVAVDATAVGAAGLAAVGAGVLGSVEEIAEIAPAQRRFTPQPRPDERSAWREFVARAAALA